MIGFKSSTRNLGWFELAAAEVITVFAQKFDKTEKKEGNPNDELLREVEGERERGAKNKSRNQMEFYLSVSIFFLTLGLVIFLNQKKELLHASKFFVAGNSSLFQSEQI
jgi:hypothetical protein